LPLDFDHDGIDQPAYKHSACYKMGFTQFIFQLYRQLQQTSFYSVQGFREYADHVYQTINEMDFADSPKVWKHKVKYLQDRLWGEDFPGARAIRFGLIRAWLRAERVSCVVILSMFSETDELRRFSGYTTGIKRYLFPWQ